jgi:translation elongation factor aEF-1 beta
MWVCGALSMGDVIVGFKVMPAAVEEDLDKIEKEIREIVKPQKMSREEIAFGLVAIHVVKIVEDAEGTLDAVEKQLRSIKGVGEVEVTGITRSI